MITDKSIENAKKKYIDLGFKYNWEGSCPTSEAMREILEASLPKIKKLEWEDYTEKNYDGYTKRLWITRSSHNIPLKYRIEYDEDLDLYFLIEPSTKWGYITNTSLDDIKEDAQRHLGKLIMEMFYD